MKLISLIISPLVKFTRAITLGLFLMVNPAFANNSIEFICQQSPTQCLENVETALSNTSYPSRTWYKYKLLQLEALFLLGNTTELNDALMPFIDKDDLPLSFLVYVKIYHAKVMIQFGETKAAQDDVAEALALLNEIQEQLPRPMRLIEIANLQIINKQLQPAEQTLLLLEKRYASDSLPLFNQELYANLGHIAARLDKLEKYLAYTQKSLNYALKIGNKQQIAVAHYNLARAATRNEKLALARKHYLHAVLQATLSKDVATQIDANIRLAEIAITEQEFIRVNELLSELQKTARQNGFDLEGYRLYQQLQHKLTKPKVNSN